METDLLDMMWQRMQAELNKIKSSVKIVENRSERAETAGGVKVVTFAQLPKAADGAADGDLLKVSNGRKVGEATGAGTGVVCYYNPATDFWLRMADDTAVTI